MIELWAKEIKWQRRKGRKKGWRAQLCSFIHTLASRTRTHANIICSQSFQCACINRKEGTHTRIDPIWCVCLFVCLLLPWVNPTKFIYFPFHFCTMRNIVNSVRLRHDIPYISLLHPNLPDKFLCIQMFSILGGNGQCIRSHRWWIIKLFSLPSFRIVEMIQKKKFTEFDNKISMVRFKRPEMRWC